VKKILPLLIILIALTATPLFAVSVPKMDKDELKSLIGSKNLVILDVRLGRDWSTSEFKIKGALRVNDADLSVVKKYPKDGIFVLYCA
jgi:rhodanese-related sulfurtransferase